MENVSWVQTLILFVSIAVMSYWNVRMSGEIWVETKFLGGWSRLTVQCAVLSAVMGFAWCYVLVIFCTKYGFGLQPEEAQTLMAGVLLGQPIEWFVIGMGGVLFLAHGRVRAWRTHHAPNMHMLKEFEEYQEIRTFQKAFERVVQKVILRDILGYSSLWILRRTDATGKLIRLFVGLATVLGWPIVVPIAIIHLYAATVPFEE